MTDTSTQTEHQETAPTSEQQPAEKTLTQSEVDRIVAERVAREKQKFADYDDLKAAATRLKEIENASKSEQQKAQERIEELTKQLAERDQQVAQATQASLKASVAAEKGVPASALTGNTKEELEASADEILAWRDAAKPPTRKPPATGLKSGASSSGDTSANPQERAAAALREMRRSGA
jgi:hypothetical protein